MSVSVTGQEFRQLRANYRAAQVQRQKKLKKLATERKAFLGLRDL